MQRIPTGAPPRHNHLTWANRGRSSSASAWAFSAVRLTSARRSATFWIRHCMPPTPAPLPPAAPRINTRYDPRKSDAELRLYGAHEAGAVRVRAVQGPVRRNADGIDDAQPRRMVVHHVKQRQRRGLVRDRQVDADESLPRRRAAEPRPVHPGGRGRGCNARRCSPAASAALCIGGDAECATGSPNTASRRGGCTSGRCRRPIAQIGDRIKLRAASIKAGKPPAPVRAARVCVRKPGRSAGCEHFSQTPWENCASV